MFSTQLSFACKLTVIAFLWSSTLVGQEPKSQKRVQKVWTNEDVEDLSVAAPQTSLMDSADALINPGSVREHYTRAKDPRWYVRQLEPLRRDLAATNTKLSTLRKFLRNGEGASAKVSLDDDTLGVTTQGEVETLESRRADLLRRIGEFEDGARQNGLDPGAVRLGGKPEAFGSIEAEPTNHEDNSINRDPKRAEIARALLEEKERLARLKKETDLLQRELILERRQVYSDPNYLSQKNGDTKLVSAEHVIAEKQQEMQRSNDRIAELEDQDEDIRLRPSPEKQAGLSNDPPGTSNGAVDLDAGQKIKKDEQYWRGRFTDLRYQIHLAERELAILQRELNVLLLQYDPNPSKTLRESVTQKEINQRRKDITEKQAEIKQLRENVSELEDEMRHAGGYPGWARE